MSGMARLARIVLNGARGDDELDPITVDLMLSSERRVVQKFPTSGWWGSLKRTEECLPFVIYPDGKMDFGSDYLEPDRFATTNLLTKRLDLGEYVTVFDGSGEHCFLVKQMLWIDELPHDLP